MTASGVVVPEVMRDALGLTADSIVDIELSGAGLLVTPRHPATGPRPEDDA